jgi:hypothetical protein
MGQIQHDQGGRWVGIEMHVERVKFKMRAESLEWQFAVTSLIHRTAGTGAGWRARADKSDQPSNCHWSNGRTGGGGKDDSPWSFVRILTTFGPAASLWTSNKSDTSSHWRELRWLSFGKRPGHIESATTKSSDQDSDE